MKEIRCPKCSEVFKVDESGYAEIVKQVRDEEFSKEVTERIENKNKEFKLIQQNIEIKYEKQIKELQDSLNLKEKDKHLAINEATEKFKEELQAKEKQIIELNSDIKSLKENIEKDKAIAVSNIRNNAIVELNKKDKLITQLNGEINTLKQSSKLEIQTLTESHEKELKAKNDVIAYWKEFKTKLSTKLLGESLEQHCQIEFNRIRATAFPNAFFEKDTDSSSGTKGDFIFKDFTSNNVEFVSIMFDMKNEMETTSKKHKNEDFFEKLDKDRREKNCEYAVLVSMLESDNELYNTGIVDVSYKYPKMYVIRPQFFIPIISIIRNAALNNAHFIEELQEYQNQNIDISNFETKLNEFQEVFGKRCKNSQKQFDNAIKGIDNAIKNLQGIKDSLLNSGNYINSANEKLQEITIKRLTRGNPTMTKKFKKLKDKNEK